jgi:hypothetical protein
MEPFSQSSGRPVSRRRGESVTPVSHPGKDEKSKKETRRHLEQDEAKSFHSGEKRISAGVQYVSLQRMMNPVTSFFVLNWYLKKWKKTGQNHLNHNRAGQNQKGRGNAAPALNGRLN